MIPASHALTGFLAGRLTRWLAAESQAPRNPLRDPIVLAAMAGSLFPDWDIVPGLIFGIRESEFHRGATHSPVGAVLQAFFVGPVGLWCFALWRRFWRQPWLRDFFSPSPSWPLMSLSAGLGLASHAAWDYLNPWGIALYWPFDREGYSGQLVHEGSLLVLALLALLTVVVASGRPRLGFSLALALILATVTAHALSKKRVESVAAERFEDIDYLIYPAAPIDCPWQVLTRTEDEYAAYCASALGSDLDLVKQVKLQRGPEIESTRGLFKVGEFLERREFPFAELHSREGGQTLVLWRDLRDALVQGDEENPSGLYVLLGPDGAVVDTHYEWQFRFWLF